MARPRTTSTAALLATVAAAAAISGCGGSNGSGASEQAKSNALAVSSTIRNYYGAIIKGDGAKACLLLTESQQRAVAAQSAKDDDCIEYLSSEVFPARKKRYFQIGSHVLYAKDIPGLDIDIALKGNHARARPRGGTVAFGLTKSNGEWKISDLGLGG